MPPVSLEIAAPSSCSCPRSCHPLLNQDPLLSDAKGSSRTKARRDCAGAKVKYRTRSELRHPVAIRTLPFRKDRSDFRELKPLTLGSGDHYSTRVSMTASTMEG